MIDEKHFLAMLLVGIVLVKKEIGRSTICFQDFLFSCHEVDKYKVINHIIVKIFHIETWKIQI